MEPHGARWHPLAHVRVNGMGWKTAASLWYNTFTHLGPSSDMRAAAQLMVARSLFYGPEALIATACAWHAVGVGDFRYSSFNTTMCARVAAATPKVTSSSCSGALVLVEERRVEDTPSADL